mmetsp:Transcript_159622/g.291231  ORF Transcript_159622/g.291231 Transcript_159622/m.291231 type:complete len:107 (+) Transcript_159622:2718-3038(+)
MASSGLHGLPGKVLLDEPSGCLDEGGPVGNGPRLPGKPPDPPEAPEPLEAPEPPDSPEPALIQSTMAYIPTTARPIKADIPVTRIQTCFWVPRVKHAQHPERLGAS